MVPYAPADTVASRPMPPRPKVPYLRLLRGLRQLTDLYEELRDASGPVTTVKLGPTWAVPLIVVVTSPEGAKQVLSGHNGVFDKESRLFQETRNLLGGNLFSVAYMPWKPRRRTLQPLFTRSHVASFSGHMAEAADALAEAWQAAPGTVDLDRDVRRLTLRVLGRTLFGRALEDDAERLATHVQRPLRYVLDRSLNPLPAPGWVPSWQRRRARASRDVLRSLVADAVAQRSHHPAGNGELIDLLLTATDPETGAGLTPEAMVQELLVFLVAGHDTTATALTATLWLLGRHPDVQRKVADEAQNLGAIPDLSRLTATRRSILEAMRLYPPAAAIPRRTTEETTICGYRIPPGSDVFVSTWAIHRDPGLWPDPTRFDPDRFLPDRAAARDRWAYLPFGAGPRSCIGDHFAMAEATIALAMLIRRVDIAPVGDTFPVDVPFTLTAKGPIPVRVAPRAPA